MLRGQNKEGRVILFSGRAERRRAMVEQHGGS